jgi:kumamolisin
MKEMHFVALPGSERVPLPGARAIGAADGDAWVEVTLKLRRAQPLPALSGRPAQPITREELAQRFGSSESDMKAVTDAFQALGLQVVAQDAGKRTVRLGGPARSLEQAFQVRLVNYAHASGDYRGRVGALHLPSTIAPVVEAVFGLGNRRAAHRRPSKRATLGDESHTTAPHHRSWFFPAELASAYDFPPGDGAGQCIGLLEFGGGYFADDLEQFRQAAKLDAVPKVVPISVHHMPTNTNDEDAGEVMLDIEVIAGTCPQATVPVYFSQFTEQGWIEALDAALHDKVHRPTVLSISWGYAEDTSTWTKQALTQVNEALHEAALLGVTVCVAAGDDGSSDGIEDGHAHVDFPASSPYVLAVGGTALRLGTHRTERAWKDGTGVRSTGGGSTGGGISTRLARPIWQSGLDIAPVNPGQLAGRIVPDVAAVASGHTGYYAVAQGQPGIIGGTSAAAPLWAALVARINATLPAGKRVGYLTPVLYGSGPGSSGPLGAQVCNDARNGDNITAVVGGFRSQTGFDAVTGWGSPKGAELLAAMKRIV